MHCPNSVICSPTSPCPYVADWTTRNVNITRLTLQCTTAWSGQISYSSVYQLKLTTRNTVLTGESPSCPVYSPRGVSGVSAPLVCYRVQMYVGLCVIGRRVRHASCCNQNCQQRKRFWRNPAYSLQDLLNVATIKWWRKREFFAAFKNLNRLWMPSNSFRCIALCSSVLSACYCKL